MDGIRLEKRSEMFLQIVFATGCSWGAERMFWTADGVYTTAGVSCPVGVQSDPR